jgi:septum site-determining protein MinC
MNNPFNEDGESMFDSSSPESLATPAAPADLSSSAGAESSSPSKGPEDRSSVITARGTAEGLVLRIDGRVEQPDLKIAVSEFLESRRSFLTGNDVAFEWVGRKPEESVVQDLSALLANEFSVTVRSSRLKPAVSRVGAPSQEAAPASSSQPGLSVVSGSRAQSPAPRSITSREKNVSLFDGIEGFEGRQSAPGTMLWDEPDARIIYGTLRSGQKIETEHSVVVFGDVNSGAEVIAGGDIIILGTLRGIAHAGAYDESGGGRVIFSLNLQPTQLRIGLVISRGSGAENAESMPRGGLPEVARVESNMVVVEPYQSRSVWSRRRE